MDQQGRPVSTCPENKLKLRRLVAATVLIAVAAMTVPPAAEATPAPQSAKIIYSLGRTWEHSNYTGRVLSDMQVPSRCEPGAGWYFTASSYSNLVGMSSVSVNPGNGSHCNYVTVYGYSGISWGTCVTYANGGIAWFGAGFNDTTGAVRLQRSDVCANQLGYWYN